MNAHLEPHPALSRAEREALDEELFCTERSFDPAELPVYLPPVPRDIAPVLGVVPDHRTGDFSDTDFSTPPYPLPRDPSPERCGAVSDGGVSYSLTNLAPGVYEVRPPAPKKSIPEEPAPERRDLRVEVNAGLEVVSGEEVRVGPNVLRVIGDESPSLIDLMLLSPPMNGALMRDGFAMTGGDVFTQEDVDEGRISCRHDGEAGEGVDSFSVATPQGEVLPTQIDIRIVPPHHAPRLLGIGTIDRLAKGMSASDILAGRADAPEECGLAVVGVAGDGSWKCSHDEGRTWLPVDGIRPARALLLSPADRLRFAARDGIATVARLTYRAWDRSSHHAGERADLDAPDAVGGASAFSREVTTATLRIRPPVALAERPLADPWRSPLGGTELVGGALAVVRLVGPGTWQYSVGGAAWRECRAVYHGRALLLGGEDRLRFVPREGATGPVSLTLRAWDGDGARRGHARLSSRASVGGDTGFGESVQTANWYLDPIPPESPAEEPGVEGEG